MFGGGMFGDPFFNDMHARMNHQMQQMDSLMNHMMGFPPGGADPFDNMLMDPFGMRMHRLHHPQQQQQGMLTDARHQMIADDPHQQQLRHHHQQQQQPRQMMPFGGLLGGGLLGNMMQQMEHAANDPDSHVYTHSTMITYDGTSGAPRYYEATNSMAKAGDVKEVRRTVRDSATGEEKMQVGKHIGQRAHVVEKKRVRGGDISEEQSFVNMDKDRVDDFTSEWQSRTRAPRRRELRDAPREITYDGPSSSSADPTPIVEEPEDTPPAETKRKRRVLPSLPKGPKIFEL